MEIDIRRVLFSLRRSGLRLFVGDDGVVHGKMRNGKPMPIEARPLVDDLRRLNDKAVELMSREVTEVIDQTVLHERLNDWMMIADGEIELAGPIFYDPKTGTAEVIYRRAAE